MGKRGPKPGSGRLFGRTPVFLASNWASVEVRKRFKGISQEQAFREMAKAYALTISIHHGDAVFVVRNRPPRRSAEEAELRTWRERAAAAKRDGTLKVREYKPFRAAGGAYASVRGAYFAACCKYRSGDESFVTECDTRLAVNLLYREHVVAGHDRGEAWEKKWLEATDAELNALLAKYPARS